MHSSLIPFHILTVHVLYFLLQDTELVIECLDIIRDLVTGFGHQMGDIADDMQGALTPKLEEERSAVRKRVIQCLGKLFWFGFD